MNIINPFHYSVLLPTRTYREFSGYHFEDETAGAIDFSIVVFGLQGVAFVRYCNRGGGGVSVEQGLVGDLNGVESYVDLNGGCCLLTYFSLRKPSRERFFFVFIYLFLNKGLSLCSTVECRALLFSFQILRPILT